MKAPHRMPRRYYARRRRRQDAASALAAGVAVAAFILAVALAACWGELAQVVRP